MKTLYLLFLFVVQTITSSTPTFSYEEGIAVLNNTNFGSVIDTFTFSVILFYEPKSKGTLNTTAEFVKTAQSVSNLYPGIKFCKMDGEIYKSYADYYGSKKLPSINLFYQGNDMPVNYTGPYVSEKIANWINKIIKDNVLEVTSLGEISNEVTSNEHVGLFIGSPSSDAFSTFLAVSTVFGDITFIWTNEESIKKNLTIQKETFVLFRQHNKERNKFVGPFNFQALKNFTRNYKYQSVMSLDRAAAVRIFDKKETAAFLLRANTGEIEAKAQDEFVSIGYEFRGRIALAVAGLSDTYGAKLAPFLGVANDSAPTVMILDYDNKQTKYRLDREITRKNIRIFLLNYFAGNLQPFLKSAPIPSQEESFDGKIRIVVGKTFDNIVLDPSKHVLLELYSPTCKVCQSFAPTYYDLAQKLAGIKDLVIAKIDGSVNDVKNIYVENFPAFFLYPKSTKQNPIEYLGEKSQREMYEFIKNHTNISTKTL